MVRGANERLSRLSADKRVSRLFGRWPNSLALRTRQDQPALIIGTLIMAALCEANGASLNPTAA